MNVPDLITRMKTLAVLLPEDVDFPAEAQPYGITPEALRHAHADARRKLTGGKPNGHGADHGASPEPPASVAPAAEWPKPLAEPAYHGLAGEVTRLIEPETEADPAAVLLQFVLGFGNAVGRGPYVRVEADRHTTNLNAVFVGSTSKGRKGTSLGRALEPLERVDPDWRRHRVKEGLSSGEGLIWQVRDPISRQERDKRTGAVEEVVVDAGVGDKRLLVTEGEFASVLRHAARQGNTLSPLIRLAWDKGDLQSLTKNSPAAATGALISIVGHVTADELRRYLDRTDAANGFANRFLFVCVRRSKELPFGGKLVEWGGIEGRLGTALATAKGIKEVARTDRFKRLWKEVYHDLSEPRPGLLGCVTARAEAQVLRLSLLYALLDGQAFLDEAHLLAALAVWDYCEASARFVFGDTLGDPVADEILRALRASAAPLTRTDISNLFGRNVEASQISRALAALAQQGLAARETVPTGGRPAEAWRVVA